MKKVLICIFLFGIVLSLTSCIYNETYDKNKKVLDSYPVNSKYAFLTHSNYESDSKYIDFQQRVKNKVLSDGKKMEPFASTRYDQTLIGNSLYFCFEYRRDRTLGIGYYAIGYVDFNTLKVYVDYFEDSRYTFDYYLSTKEFLVYKLHSIYEDPNTIYVVFFKDTCKVEYNYDISKLKYDPNDIEEKHTKDYYIENGIKYDFDDYDRTLTNTEDGTVINLPYRNDILDKVPLVKEMYDNLTYDNISIYAFYISTGDELFFYIIDRPTNSLNAPYMVFKCNMDFSEVEYLGYCENWLRDIILK